MSDWRPMNEDELKEFLAELPKVDVFRDLGLDLDDEEDSDD